MTTHRSLAFASLAVIKELGHSLRAAAINKHCQYNWYPNMVGLGIVS